jgi:predicted phage terminase large subunit-like protein
VELKPHTDKVMRIASLAPLVENGTLRFRKDQMDAINEFLEFPRGAHDDIPDIIEQLVGMVRKFAPLTSEHTVGREICAAAQMAGF